MTNYISILRGINVSGKRMIKMLELKAMYESMGYINIKTYIQSGNVLFQSKESNPELLGKLIEDKILEKFNFDVPVIIITQKEIKYCINHNLFLKREDIQLDKLHVTFLSTEASQDLIDKIKDFKYTDDEFIIDGKLIYLYCPKNYGESKLSNNFFESKLKVKATTRNWKTVNELGRLLKIFEA
ncbi:MAG TPA: DUF1697 domain-containing protein [Saprospiraceae bacterium]|nr:DUF1697 domain-containing protein [Saprospiraceae bacterium]